MSENKEVKKIFIIGAIIKDNLVGDQVLYYTGKDFRKASINNEKVIEYSSLEEAEEEVNNFLSSDETQLSRIIRIIIFRVDNRYRYSEQIEKIINPDLSKAGQLIKVLNNMWKALPPISLSEFNNTFYVSGKKSEYLKQLEVSYPKVGYKKIPDSKNVLAITMLSILATVTDVLVDKRLAANIDNGFIVGWSWYKHPAVKFRKYKCKHIVNAEMIEAVQLTWDNWNDICNFLNGNLISGVFLDDNTLEPSVNNNMTNTIGAKIIGIDGPILAKQSDYIIKNKNGNYYPVSTEYFDKTYKEVFNE